MVALVALFAASASGWVNSPELKKEIADKEAALAKDPGSPEALFDLAITYAYTNKIQEGLDALKRSGELSGDVKKFSLKLINKHFAEVKKNPYDWRARFRLAFAYYFGGYKEYSITEFRNIAVIDPKSPWPHGYIAIILAEDGKWNEAVASMKKAIKIDSNVAAFHLGLGQGYYKLNMPWQGNMETLEALRLKALGF